MGFLNVRKIFEVSRNSKSNRCWNFLLSILPCLHIFFSDANTAIIEIWMWGLGNQMWYKSLVKSLVFNSLLETFLSLVISKTSYSHFQLTVFLQWNNILLISFFYSIFMFLGLSWHDQEFTGMEFITTLFCNDRKQGNSQ